jgi:APA family basic amino acid/polyamine antiporter
MPSPLFARKPISLLLAEMNGEHWLRLVVWLVIGFVVYFGYGRKHSVMAERMANR